MAIVATPELEFWDDPPPDDLDDLDDQEPVRQRYQFRAGGGFILDSPPNPLPVWGRGQEVAWADGESLMIAALQGLGKSTIAQQLALGRCGFTEYGELFGLPIHPGHRRVLYLAMDRPRQISRSLRRMVGEAWRRELDARLSVWEGPPPFDLAKHPRVLLQMCQDADADTVIVDSLKDAAVGLTDDEVGASWNRARQYALAAGVQVLECHHNRKAVNGGRAERLGIDDVYGSTWLTSGTGSVVLLAGAPGDPVVSFHHVKQPAGEVGPFRIVHDHEAGRSAIWHAVDLVALVAAAGTITAKDAAAALFEVDKPSPAEVAKARRKLDKLTRDGLLRVAVHGDDGTATATQWGLW